MINDEHQLLGDIYYQIEVVHNALHLLKESIDKYFILTKEHQECGKELY